MGGTMNADVWTFYKDAAGEWRWKRCAPNGEEVAASTEGYKNKRDCKANAVRCGWTVDQPTEYDA